MNTINDTFATDNRVSATSPPSESFLRNRLESSSDANRRRIAEERAERQTGIDRQKAVEQFIEEQKKLDENFSEKDERQAVVDFLRKENEENDKKTYISIAEHKKAMADLKVEIISELENNLRLVPYRRDAGTGEGLLLDDDIKPAWQDLGLLVGTANNQLQRWNNTTKKWVTVAPPTEVSYFKYDGTSLGWGIFAIPDGTAENQMLLWDGLAWTLLDAPTTNYQCIQYQEVNGGVSWDFPRVHS